jgi:hypothetical protein
MSATALKSSKTKPNITLQNTTRGLMGNWTFSKEDDFTLPNGEWRNLPADSLERIHNEFAKECN